MSQSLRISQSQAHAEDEIRAVPLPRPGRIAAAAVIAIVLGCFLYGAATNASYEWSTYGRYLTNHRILSGVGVTIVLTVIAMTIGVVTGVVAALMRMSDNPVLHYVALLYIWVFRGTPVYVQLVFWGLATSIYRHVTIGIPLTYQFAHLNTSSWLTPFVAAFLGLGLNEGAYMSEIVRAGMGSIDEGQREASMALGMSSWLSVRRVILPQAMRVIIPPTGNELIGMLKTTSLVIAVPFTVDLFSQSNQIAALLYRPVPLLLVASTWYLAITTLLMAGQYFVERHFSRGSARSGNAKQLLTLARDADGSTAEREGLD